MTLSFKADGTIVPPTPMPTGNPPVKAEDHGMTGEQVRRAQAEEHKAALKAINRNQMNRG